MGDEAMIFGENSTATITVNELLDMRAKIDREEAGRHRVLEDLRQICSLLGLEPYFGGPWTNIVELVDRLKTIVSDAKLGALVRDLNVGQSLAHMPSGVWTLTDNYGDPVDPAGAECPEDAFSSAQPQERVTKR